MSLTEERQNQSMSMTNTIARRNFLKTSLATTSVTALPFWWKKALGQQSPNDRITLGAIGTSVYENRYVDHGLDPGRGMTIAMQAASLGDMVAVADVNLGHARFFKNRLAQDIDVHQDYRKLLERKDIDAVTIGTPDHWHVKIAIDALRAGKHVYCEKPLTLTVDEGKQLLKVVDETDLVFQVGTQQRSEFEKVFLKAVAIARSGRLGNKLHALVSIGTGEKGGPFKNIQPPPDLDWDMWLGQAPKVPYCKQRCDFDFRWWSEYAGGQVTDWGVHHMDIAMWALGLENTGPVSIEGKGTFPSIPNGYNTATIFDCRLTFEDGQVCQLLSGENELVLSGDKGRIRVNRGGLTGKPIEELTPSDEDRINDEIVKLCHGYDTSGMKGTLEKAGAHMQNFFDCIQNGGKAISDPHTHHRSCSACHLANIAMQLNRKLQFDPVKEDFVGDEEASAMLKRKQRSKYSIYV